MARAKRIEEGGRTERRRLVNDYRREMILAAARRIFAAQGLEGASLRAIAQEAGYTHGALYFYYASKEEIYGDLLAGSLDRLLGAVRAAVPANAAPDERLRGASLAFFDYYRDRPDDLDLGFYLFRGGMKPRGLGRARDAGLNAGLAAALRPIADAGRALGASRARAESLMVDIFAHAAGLLLLSHTGRIRMFGQSAEALMRSYVDGCANGLRGGRA